MDLIKSREPLSPLNYKLTLSSPGGGGDVYYLLVVCESFISNQILLQFL